MNVETASDARVQWALGAAGYTVGLLVAGVLVGTRPLAALAQLVIGLTPGSLATLSIELLGKWSQPALLAGIVGGFVVAGGLLRVAVGRLPASLRDDRLGAGLLAVATLVGVALAGGSAFGAVLVTLIAVGPVVSARWLLIAGESPDRRSFLRRAGVAGVALSGVGAGAAVVSDVGREERTGVEPGASIDQVTSETKTAATAMQEKTEGTTTPTVTPGSTSTASEMTTDNAKGVPVTVTERETDEPFGFDFEGMPPAITPVADHYVVDKQVNDPTLSADEWALTVGLGDATTGEVTFSLTDLVGHPDRVDQVTTMACISNPVGGPLISTVRWRGVPLNALLSEIQVADGATDVITEAADGYSEAIPLSVVRERDDIMIAYGMNGETLPEGHGFPARLLIPGRYGMKMTKWITGVGASTSDEVGYWTQRGWTETAEVKTLSAIRAAQRRGDRIALGGLAFAGNRGIDRVEVSLDAGDTWNEATLDDPASPYTRHRWRYETQRSVGSVQAIVRATDGTGSVQTRERTNPHPSGATGWHRAAFDL